MKTRAAVVVTAIVAGLVLLAPLGDASAQRGVNSGYCPARTCATSGGNNAANVKNGSAANCQTTSGRGGR